MKFPAPVIGIAIEPKTKADVDKMGMALAKLKKIQRLLLEQMRLQGKLYLWYGLHLDILVDRMKREFKVEVNQGEPQVEYKEAFTKVLFYRNNHRSW
jgi:elongation factor G